MAEGLLDYTGCRLILPGSLIGCGERPQSERVAEVRPCTGLLGQRYGLSNVVCGRGRLRNQ